MDSARTTFVATCMVIVTGFLWRFYWIPARRIAELGLTGAWGTLAVVGAATAELDCTTSGGVLVVVAGIFELLPERRVT